MKDDNVILLGLLAVLGIPALVAVSALLNGFVLMKLWTWFVVSTFALPRLTMPFAIGLALVVRFLSFEPDAVKSEFKKPFSEQLITALLRPFMTLLFGWIVTLFM